MKFFAIIALPALALAAAIPNASPEVEEVDAAKRQGQGLPNLPLDPTCAAKCVTGVTGCSPTNLTDLDSFTGWYVLTLTLRPM